MPTFTAISYASDAVHVSQHRCDTPEHAVAEHIGQWPSDDGAGPLDEELRWLLDVAEGRSRVTLLDQCPGAWTWLEGAQHSPQYLTWVVQTEIPGPAA